MASIEQARADRAWQAARGRAATGALDWLAANPGAPLMAMPMELRDGLSPEQTEALDRTAMNGGRVVTDRDLYDRLDEQAVRNPEEFTGVDLTQHRLSLGDSEYNRLTKLQQALAEGKPDPAFERHRLGRLFLGEGLRAANVDPSGEEGRAARQQIDRLLGAFESVEGKPATMADIRGLVDDVVGNALPRGGGRSEYRPGLGRRVGRSERRDRYLATFRAASWASRRTSLHRCTYVDAHTAKGISPSQIDDALKGKRILQANGNTMCIGAAVIVILSPSGGYVTCYWK